MKRRQFLATSLAAPGLAAQQPGAKSREYYALRRYQLQSGQQEKLADSYFREALVPGLNRLGIRPVGVFSVDIGPDSPSFYVLMPSTSVEALVTADFRLEHDDEYLKAGAPFLNTPAKQPAYVRMESSLMLAFEGMPRLTLPPGSAVHGARVFELRTYESHSKKANRKKIEMFNAGEIGVFDRSGFQPVFFGETLVGPQVPNLTYMVTYPSVEERGHFWQAFMADPEKTRLFAIPEYADKLIVSKIRSVMLRPIEGSQI